MQQLPTAMAAIAHFVLLTAASLTDASTIASLGAAKESLSPVTRVVELLQGLTSRIEADHKAEEDLYENFVCWATSIISQKEKSNAASKSRVDTLNAYISDVQEGRIELTSERVDLEKNIETLTGDIEVATQMRTAEAHDFNLATDDMQAAIDALTKAIDVLRIATAGHTDGVLMSLKGGLGEGSEARAKEAAALSHAVELGKRVLTKGDAVFLQRLLTAQVPERTSWNKLNRQATFKMSYKARSFKIQGVLAKMLETIASNLQDAAKKEQNAVEQFNRLTNDKGTEKNAALDALSKMDTENGAKQLSLSEANEERNSLGAQINNDEGYIAQVQTALRNKKTEWQARQVLRQGELAAISRAIKILHSDSSRDLFKKSFASQGLFFLQESSSQTSNRHAQRSERAVQALRAAAAKSKDSRLAVMAATAASGHFDDVLAAIDSMLQILRTEEESDLSAKEQCEEDRAARTREAIQKSRKMDELTEEITALLSRVAELKAEILEKEEQVLAINHELNETARARAEEHAEYLKAKTDDQDATGLIASAKQVLETFYRDNGLMLMQGHQQAPFESTAGEAPPPPPKTWTEAYKGKTEETEGILAILELIRDDILKDISKAEEEEQAAVTLYSKTKTNLDSQRDALTNGIIALTSDKNGAVQDISDKTGERSLLKGELKVILDAIKTTAPGCDFLAVNFHVRSQNRQIEIDGLEKAKDILQGGRFDGLPDPDRELKPGDAFVQRRKFLRQQS